MNKFILVAVLSIVSFPVSASGPAVVSPNAGRSAVLPKPLKKAKLELGMSFDELSRKRKNIALNKTESFRKVYIEQDFSQEIATVVYYVAPDSSGKERVYEFIIVMKEGSSPEELGKKTWGDPNHQAGANSEWRFSPEKTGLEGTMASWVFQNKLVVAYAMPGSEWEPGFDQ